MRVAGRDCAVSDMYDLPEGPGLPACMVLLCVTEGGGGTVQRVLMTELLKRPSTVTSFSCHQVRENGDMQPRSDTRLTFFYPLVHRIQSVL